MNTKSVVYMSAQDTELLHLSGLLGRELERISDDVRILRCEFVSDEGPYLRVMVPYKSGRKEKLGFLMLPHQVVLMIVQVPHGSGDTMGFLPPPAA